MLRILLIVTLVLNFSLRAQSPIFSSKALHHPIVAKNGMVASQHPLATQVGIEILEQGGNAVDAAVGVGFALAVVLPRAGNLGGGGFMLVHEANSGETKAINYRERAPGKASRDMYLGKDGEIDRALINSSYQSTGVPGTVSGLLFALEKYGTMSPKQVLAPAIRLAKKGFAVTYDLERVLKALEGRIRKWPESEKIFYRGKQGYYESGDLLVQADLAKSLKLIAKQGAKAFYEGPIAELIVADMQANGGLISMEDMADYSPQFMDVIWGEFHGYQVASMPPPSSGGVHLLQILNILEKYPLKESGHNSAASIHMMTEAMKLAYADRSKHLGDPLFWNVPVAELLDKSYADHLRAGIDPERARPSTEIMPGNPTDYESEETTHFSVVDKYGNVVSNTYTLNFSFGNGAVAKGTGILLNNEMSDFAAKPGSPDAFGLIGGESNKVEPGKRPLSSMTPSIVFRDGKPFLVTGSPGGSRIITTVLQVILNSLVHEMNVAEATHAPRIHHQWFPDILYIEKNLNADTRAILEALGHKMTERNAMGSTQSIMIKDGLLYGASDPRRPDARTKGY